MFYARVWQAARDDISNNGVELLCPTKTPAEVTRR